VPYVVVVNLLPQDATQDEKWQVLNAVHDDKQTILQSADDAARLVVPGKPGSKVRIWAPDRWQDSIVDWLEDKGVELIDLLEFEPPPPPESFLLWPVDNQHIVNSPFNDERSYGPHEGIDLYAQEGDAIYACRDGQVVWASDQRRSGGPSAYGRHIIIEHDDGWITWYCHLIDMISAAGDVVERGDVIGAAGNTGNSTGPHLHLNVQHIGAGLSGYVIPDVVDPGPLLKE
jgi:murein DD-endopeptidase MepM/ murein hydrolase activator NlpD